MYFQDWWQQAYNLKEETNITATDLKYGANMETYNDDDTVDTSSITQFSKAFAANSSVISQLSEANNTMNETIHGNIQNLNQQMEAMNNALQHIALNAERSHQQQAQQPFCSSNCGQGRGSRGRGFYNHNNFGNNFQQPPFPFTPQPPVFTPPPPPPQPFQLPHHPQP